EDARQNSQGPGAATNFEASLAALRGCISCESQRLDRHSKSLSNLRTQIEETTAMSTDEIRANVKKSIAKITSISFDEIPDHASYKDDLQLDSLTILEIAVDAEYQFQVKLSDDDLGEIRTVDDTVRMVQQYLTPVAA